MLLPDVAPSVGVSKSGAELKVSTPVAGTIEKSPWSSPPVMEKVTVSASGSVAVTVVTAVWFSAALTAAVAPPPSEVMTGGSFPSVTIHFREKDRLKAESLKRKILELLEKEGGKQ